MTAQDIAAAAPAATAKTSSPKLDGAAAAFGVAASVAILFNTAVVAVNESFPWLATQAANWTGHPWRTDGLADLLVFLILGFALMRRRFAIGGYALASLMFVCIALAAVGLGAWTLSR